MKTFLTAIILGLFGALAVFISMSLAWPTWVMFIAWVSYYLFGKSLPAVLWPFIQIITGIAMGVCIRVSAQWLSDFTGELSMPVAVFFFIGSLAFFARFTKLANIPAWFLGLIIFFGIHPPLELLSVSVLLIPIAAGLMFAWLNDTVLQKVSHNRKIPGS